MHVGVNRERRFTELERVYRGGRNRIGRREKWPKQSWQEGEKEKLGVGRIELDGPG